jgi:Antidote-toxin recognition MazE, bacterial antitoxin
VYYAYGPFARTEMAPSLSPRKIVSIGGSLAVTLPPDWIRGNDLKAGDRVELSYDEIVLVRPLKLKSASATEGSNLGGPARRPVQPAEIDEGVLADAGG